MYMQLDTQTEADVISSQLCKHNTETIPQVNEVIPHLDIAVWTVKESHDVQVHFYPATRMRRQG